MLARYGLVAKKSWGQNFLVDHSALDRIVQAVEVGPEDVVVEIGAGLGTLTAALIAPPASARTVLAIERDREMLDVLRGQLGADPRVEIRAEDAVRFDFREAARRFERPLVVVGNLPYQLTTALLFAIVDAGAAVTRAVLMVQREFAARVVANPGTKIYGRLSVMVQQMMAARLLFNVSPAAFFPKPRVVSSVLSLARRPQPLGAVRDQAMFARVVKEAFATRRKMLRRSIGDAFGDDVAAVAFEASDIDGRRRPEQLSVTELACLAHAVADAEVARGPTVKG